MKQRQLLYHILLWASIYLLWVLIFRSYSVSLTKTIKVEFCYLLFITADYYAITNFIVPRFLFKQKYSLFVVSIVMVIALSALLRAIVASQMNLHFFSPIQKINFATLYVNSITNISLWVLLVTIAKMLLDRLQTQKQVAFLEKERAKTELSYLRAQINPHALFNSLNTVYGYIDKSNQVARNVLLQFSELLRYQLYDCVEEKVNLQKEIDYVKNYVAFQRLRKDERLEVIVQIKYFETSLIIAPLLLVVLIENAFKFASNFCDKENKVIIKIFAEDNMLHSSFSNTKELVQDAVQKSSNGIGIANLKRRLELLYPEKYKLTTTIENEFYETNLMLDLS